MCPFADAISQTAQAFLPATENLPATSQRSVVSKLHVAGAGVGVLCASALYSLIAHGGGMFTKDVAVHAAMRGAAPWVAASFLVQGVMLAAEGTRLARRDLKYVAAVYIAGMATFPALCARTARSAPTTGLLWKGFVAFQVMRLFSFGARVIATEYCEPNVTVKSEDWLCE